MFFIYKGLKKKVEQMGVMPMISGYLNQSASLQLIKGSILSPFGFVLGSLLLIIVAPFMFPFSVITGLKKLVGYKSKLEKKADAEEKQMEEAMAASKKQSAEFMKSEGRGVIEDDSEIFPAKGHPLDLLQPNHAGMMILKDGRAVNYGVIRIENNILVYYTKSGMSAFNAPAVDAAMTEESQRLKALPKEELITQGFVATVSLDDIERVMF